MTFGKRLGRQVATVGGADHSRRESPVAQCNFAGCAGGRAAGANKQKRATQHTRRGRGTGVPKKHTDAGSPIRKEGEGLGDVLGRRWQS